MFDNLDNVLRAFLLAVLAGVGALVLSAFCLGAWLF